MSWTGEYWGKDGALAKAEQQFENSKKEIGDCISYASVCYSAANRVLADVARLRWSGFRHLWSGLFLAIKAVKLVDSAVLKWPLFQSKDAVAETVDIACSIYSRYSWLLGGRRSTLSELINVACNLCAQIDKSNNSDCVEPHTIAFLKLHIIRFNKQKLKKGDVIFGDLIELGLSTELKGNLAQASRIYRQLSEVIVEDKDGCCLKLAEKLARQAGATDQLAKMP